MPNSDVRGQLNYTNSGSGLVNIAADGSRNLLTAQGQPAYLETARRGGGYTVQLASGVAPLVAAPTTVAALELFNNSATQVLVIRDLFAFRLLGTAAAQTYSLWAQVTTTKAVPTLTALTLFSMSGKASLTPTAVSDVVTGVGTTVVANGWRPYGPPVAYVTEAATPMNAFSVEMNGRIIVPRNTSLCLHAVGSTTAGTLILGCTYDLVTATVES